MSDQDRNRQRLVVFTGEDLAGAFSKEASERNVSLSELMKEVLSARYTPDAKYVAREKQTGRGDLVKKTLSVDEGTNAVLKAAATRLGLPFGTLISKLASGEITHADLAEPKKAKKVVAPSEKAAPAPAGKTKVKAGGGKKPR